MTRQRSFKQVVREHARRTGQRYTQARADLEGIDRPFAGVRPIDLDAVAAHLGETYGTRVASVLPIDDDPRTRPRGSWPGHYPSTLLVQRDDGPAWVARVFSSAADRLERVRDDADILRWLAAVDYPAERLAHAEPVSTLDGAAILVTDLIEGHRPSDPDGRVEDPAVFHELGSLLGRLHALPPTDGAPARAGGSEEHDGGFHLGRPKEDLAAAMAFLVSIEDAVPAAARDAFVWLRDEVEAADDAEGLPEAFTHGNFHVWATVGAPGPLQVVGWAGSGRGPRLPALAWLLRTASEADPDAVGAVVRGYAEHVSPTAEELDRLAGVLAMRPLWLTCLDLRETVRRGGVPTVAESEHGPGMGFHQPGQHAVLAATVAEAFG